MQIQHVNINVAFSAPSCEDAWQKYVMGTPFAATLSSLEHAGRTGVLAEARRLFEQKMQAAGRIADDGSVT